MAGARHPAVAIAALLLSRSPRAPAGHLSSAGPEARHRTRDDDRLAGGPGRHGAAGLRLAIPAPESGDVGETVGAVGRGHRPGSAGPGLTTPSRMDGRDTAGARAATDAVPGRPGASPGTNPGERPATGLATP